MELEENDQIDRGPPANRVAVGDEIAHKGKIEGALKMSVEMIVRYSRLEGNQYGTLKVAHFGWTEHCTPPFIIDAWEMLLPSRCDFQQPGAHWCLAVEIGADRERKARQRGSIPAH